MTDPYAPPSSDISKPDTGEQAPEYIGFWSRVAASIVDNILIAAITYPLLFSIYGSEYFSLASNSALIGIGDFILFYVFPFVAIITFWIYKSATPGKMAVKAKIVDARTGGKPSTGQLIGRYFGYFVSLIPLGLGMLWVAWDKKKQGWHDKLARTVVVRINN